MAPSVVAACISKASWFRKKSEREITGVCCSTHQLAFQIAVQTGTRGTNTATRTVRPDTSVPGVAENLLKFAVV